MSAVPDLCGLTEIDNDSVIESVEDREDVSSSDVLLVT